VTCARPRNAITWGLVLAKFVMVTEAVRSPVAVGLKVAVMVRVPATGTGVAQIFF
jgi:hypothetical protein